MCVGQVCVIDEGSAPQVGHAWSAVAGEETFSALEHQTMQRWLSPSN